MTRGKRGKYKTKPLAQNVVCEGCGKSFHVKTYALDIIKCCSRECRLVRLHNVGGKKYWECIEKENNISLKEWLLENYITNEWSVKKVAEHFKCSRRAVSSWLDMFSIPARGISADNNIRYKHMTDEQKKDQVSSANTAIRKMYKDEKWKSSQCRKVLKSQNFNESMPERMFKDALYEAGITGGVAQYQDHWWSVDVAFPEKKIAIEIDGAFWHKYPRVVEKDARKNKWFESRGWTVLHFSADTITRDIVEYIDCVTDILKAS